MWGSTVLADRADRLSSGFSSGLYYIHSSFNKIIFTGLSYDYYMFFEQVRFVARKSHRNFRNGRKVLFQI